MAHKGRLYKLWFRRDAAWEASFNYTFGWPEAYMLTTSTLMTSARYAVSQMDTVPAINLNKTFDRTWTSAPVGGFFDNAYWRLSFFEDPQEDIRHFKYEVRHSAIIDTPLFSATYQLRNQPGAYPLCQGGHFTELHFLSPDIQVDTERFTLTFFAARWNICNPA